MSSTPAPAATARVDRRFIEEHRLVERYLDGQLPFKGARELENWCRANPELLAELKLAQRTQAGLKLLEATGSPQDLGEQRPPWWRTVHALAGLGALLVLCLVTLWVVHGRLVRARGELEDARARAQQGSLVQPSAERRVTVVPDREADAGRARVLVNHAEPSLVDLHLDLSRSRHGQFRLVLDKRDQGRALIVNGVLRDSNGELRSTFNSSGLAAGTYLLRIEGIPLSGAPEPEGWVTIEVR